MLKVFLIPILKDNYVFVAANLKTKECVIVDPGQAAPVKNLILKEQLRPRAILLTHHHWDHIGGVQELKKSFDVRIYAPEKEQKSIDFADQYLSDGDAVREAGFNFKTLDLSGHTYGHIGYWEEKQNWLFSGDVLFSMGCGRIFDGSIEDHYRSLLKIKNLPPETWVYCTHEYTELNLGFCQKKFPQDQELQSFAEQVRSLRQNNEPTVPFQLKQELALNPFLKVNNETEFITLREERNSY
ncbi:hydroxyacylglutathione hydrolase [Bdellovibrio sp. HCB337]|uniref:hydroxyacylglutathione hydrolase n=1 Tax=Bdellovibrio sp. HCB337 TaxID=3394358 RepID=UPI0039A6D19D